MRAVDKGAFWSVCIYFPTHYYFPSFVRNGKNASCVGEYLVTYRGIKQ